MLARLVIPDLWTGAAQPQNPIKNRVILEIASVRATLQAIDTKRQIHFNKQRPLYLAKKDTFQKAELYRAKVMLFNSGTLDPS